MDFLSVLEIIVVVICAITYGFMLFFKVRGNVLGAVSELIALAEASGLTARKRCLRSSTACTSRSRPL